MTIGRWIGWVISNGLLVVMMNLWFVHSIAGARNIAILLIVLCFIVSLWVLFPKVQEAIRKAKPLPRWWYCIDVAFDVGVILALAWHGSWVLCSMYCIHALLLGSANSIRGKALPANA